MTLPLGFCYSMAQGNVAVDPYAGSTTPIAQWLRSARRKSALAASPVGGSSATSPASAPVPGAGLPIQRSPALGVVLRGG
jgi:hypothetical protein